ncbi:MAG TPA: SHOCT domain-containing protein [Rhizomicrobium sp.]|jgi:putative membrane protein|nr:SHOCT domain-containing protein [Rhizomicrobium sp.]
MLHALFFWPFAFWALGPFHGLFSLLVLILVFSLIFGRRRYYYGYHPWYWHGGASRSDALAVLEARYARGEIQREEYLQKKQDLGG